MNKLGFFLLLSLFSTFDAAAAFVLNGTRFVYEEGRNSVLVEVENQSDNLFAGHVWIDNNSLNDDEVHMVVSPSIFKVNPGGKQVVRLLSVNDDLPKNKETLLWLNVQEIPQKIEPDDANNVLAIALNTKVKVLFRPKVLIEGRVGAEKKFIKIIEDGGVIRLYNGSPYYFAITNVYKDGKKIKLSNTTSDAIAQFSPGESVVLTEIDANGIIKIDAINDWGGVEQYEIY